MSTGLHRESRCLKMMTNIEKTFEFVVSIAFLPIVVLFCIYTAAAVIIGSILIGDLPRSWMKEDR